MCVLFVWCARIMLRVEPGKLEETRPVGQSQRRADVRRATTPGNKKVLERHESIIFSLESVHGAQTLPLLIAVSCLWENFAGRRKLCKKSEVAATYVTRAA